MHDHDNHGGECVDPTRRALARVPSVSLVIDGERYTGARVEGFNAHGMNLEFAAADAPLVQGGDAITASLSMAGPDLAADLPARVLFSAGRGAHVLVALHIELPPDWFRDIAAGAAAEDDRRETPRVRTAPNARRATARSVLASATAVEIVVLNHSPAGIGFLVDVAAAAQLDGHAELTLELRRAPGAAPRPLRVHVRHHARRDDGIFYGCMFAAHA